MLPELMLAEYIFGFFLGLNSFEDEYHSRTTSLPETIGTRSITKTISVRSKFECENLTVDFGRPIRRFSTEHVLPVTDFVLVCVRVRVSQMIRPALRFFA